MAAKRCSYCRAKKEMTITTPIYSFCCFACAIAKKNEQEAKRIKKEKTKKKKLVAEENRELRKLKETIKPKVLAEAQTAFNKYIRLRDYYEACISCQKSKEEVEAEQGWKTGGCWDAGHYMTRGAKGQLRFVLFNVHKQCKSCNGGGGKFSSKAATVDAKYRINLIEKIGIEKVEWLENNNEIDLKKGDIEYLERIKKIFNRRARILSKKLTI
jgi:hypothetical protein